MLAVVIPAYNRSELLADALNSLICQTKKRFITIVVDDNSEENLKEVVDKYTNKLHIVYLKQPKNLGPGAARNRGLHWCMDHNIELVMFLDSDDLLLPKAIERLSKEINITNSDIVISQIQGETKDKNIGIVPNTETVWTHGKIYRVSFLKQNNIFFPEFRTNEDLGFNTVAFYKALKNQKASFIEEEHYLWRHSESSITRNKESQEKLIIQLSKDFLKAIFFAYKKFLELNLNIEEIGPKIIHGMYCYTSYLKELNAFSSEEDTILKEIYSNAFIKNYIKDQYEKKTEGIFAEVKQTYYYFDRTFIPKQNIYDFISEYSNINLRGDKE